MAQTTISKFFKNVSMEEDESDVEGPESKDLAYYQELLIKQDRASNLAKIICSKGSTAACWTYFGSLYVADKKVLGVYKFCKLCFDENTKLKKFGMSTSTTNYTNHLRTAHNLDVNVTNSSKNAKATARCLKSSEKCTKFTHSRRLTEMCCIDLQPFHTVERAGFRKYVQYFDPSVYFPTARTLASTALDDVYKFYLNAVKEKLATSPKNICIVLDMWTEKFKRISYINIKAHYCEDFVLKQFSLTTEYFPRPHTAKAIADKISDTIKEFGLEKRKLKAVTDGGSNIVSCLKIKNIERFSCLAHMVHLFLSADLLKNPSFLSLSNIIRKLKEIFRALRYRGEDMERLQQLKQNEKACELIISIHSITEAIECEENVSMGYLDEEAVMLIERKLEAAVEAPQIESLKNSVQTRWNSTLAMIKSFCQNLDLINILLLQTNNQQLLIPEMEKEIIKEFGDFLDIFSESTIYLQGQEFATISASIYFFENINSKLQQYEMVSQFGVIIEVYNFAQDNFHKRFPIFKAHVVAALLDPCQKNWNVLAKYLKKIPKTPIPDNYILDCDVGNPITKEQLLYQELKHIDAEELPSGSSSLDKPPEKKDKISGTRRKMLEFVHETGSSSKDSLRLEIQKYFDVQVVEAESLDWWRANKTIFPRIAMLANTYLGIPATSASSEIAFSVAGSCITQKRSSLHPSTAKRQLFIHDNYKAVKD